ncbi:MAG: phosphotransferase [Gammaproteobacteria bacterium]
MSSVARDEQTLQRRAAALADDAVLARVVTDARPALHAQRWRREFMRFDPAARCFALVSLASIAPPGVALRIAAYRDESCAAAEEAAPRWHGDLGWVVVSDCGADPELPGLAPILAQAPLARVLRYRPLRRCTVYVPDAGGGARVVKVFADGRGASLDADARELWRAARDGALGFEVAQPDRYDPATSSVWQHVIDGRPLEDALCGPGGVALAAAMGRALATLTKADVEPSQRFTGRDQMARTARYANELVARLPDQAAAVAGMMTSLEAIHARAALRPLRPIHGAPHAHQWLDCGRCLALVDFDRFCRGDPELDAATFIAEMDFEDAVRVPIARINAAFLRGYMNVAGPLDEALLQAYRCHKRIAKALKHARALHGDRKRKASRHLRFAQQCLEAIGEGMRQ